MTNRSCGAGTPVFWATSCQVTTPSATRANMCDMRTFLAVGARAAAACLLLGFAAFAGMVAWVAASFPQIKAEPVSWPLVSAMIAASVLGVVCAALAARSAVARFGFRRMNRDS